MGHTTAWAPRRAAWWPPLSTTPPWLLLLLLGLLLALPRLFSSRSVTLLLRLLSRLALIGHPWHQRPQYMPAGSKYMPASRGPHHTSSIGTIEDPGDPARQGGAPAPARARPPCSRSRTRKAPGRTSCPRAAWAPGTHSSKPGRVRRPKVEVQEERLSGPGSAPPAERGRRDSSANACDPAGRQGPGSELVGRSPLFAPPITNTNRVWNSQVF